MTAQAFQLFPYIAPRVTGYNVERVSSSKRGKHLRSAHTRRAIRKAQHVSARQFAKLEISTALAEFEQDMEIRAAMDDFDAVLQATGE